MRIDFVYTRSHVAHRATTTVYLPTGGTGAGFGGNGSGAGAGGGGLGLGGDGFSGIVILQTESLSLHPFAINLINPDETADKIPILLIRETASVR